MSSFNYTTSFHYDDSFVESSGLISDNARRHFTTINYAIIGEFVAVVGSVTNIFNMIVFVKMDLKDAVNLSFFAMAVSDFASCVTLFWHNLLQNPLFQALDIPINPYKIHYLTGGVPHVAFSRITVCITTFIAFERCICVLYPLKVQQILPLRTVTIVLACIFVFVLALIAPMYIHGKYSWGFDPMLNRTIFKISYPDDTTEPLVRIANSSGFVLTLVAMVLVTTFTALLVAKLREKTRWREKAKVQISDKNVKVTKTVVIVATILIVCYTPVMITLIWAAVDQKLSPGGIWKNLYHTMFSFSFLFVAINASCNTLVYYKTSTNFRAQFDAVFLRWKTTQE